jgi:hypothetical protein
LEGFRRLNTANRGSDKSPENPSLRTNGFPDLSEPVLPLICQRDDGMFALGWHDDAPGPFASRQHAEAASAREAMPA